MPGHTLLAWSPLNVVSGILLEMHDAEVIYSVHAARHRALDVFSIGRAWLAARGVAQLKTAQTAGVVRWTCIPMHVRVETRRSSLPHSDRPEPSTVAGRISVMKNSGLHLRMVLWRCLRGGCAQRVELSVRDWVPSGLSGPSRVHTKIRVARSVKPECGAHSHRGAAEEETICANCQTVERGWERHESGKGRGTSSRAADVAGDCSRRSHPCVGI